MTDNLETKTAHKTPEPTREHGPDDLSVLAYLRRVCEDASHSAATIAELVRLDNDPDTAEILTDISAERAQFSRRLVRMLNERGHHDGTRTKSTLRGRLLRWRLVIAKHVPVGYNDRDDRRFLLRLALRSSDQVTKAYANAEARQLGRIAKQEIHQQAEAIRRTHHTHRRLAAKP